MKKLLSVLLPLLCLAAPASAQTAAPPTLTFGSGWTLSLAGKPRVGGSLRIVYDVSRLSQCRGPSWSITGHAMTNRGPVQSFPVANASTGDGAAEVTRNLTTAGNLQLWFQVTDSTGCSAWDSNFGGNYHTTVFQDPTLTFAEGGTHSLFGTLRGGSTLMVDYDIDRLPTCRAYYAEYTAWNVHVYYRIDGGAEQLADLTVGWGEFNTRYRDQAPAFIPIPAGATTLELRFYNGDRKGCAAYDPANGTHYVFTVQ